MKAKEATARIKINRLLEEAGWRFFDDTSGPANIVLEPNTKITESQIDALGEDFQTTKNGFIDFLLLDKDGRPLIVLEAKSEGKNPLAAKEQARRYAREQNARFVILSNGNIHYLWDLKQGNPSVITKFPSPDAIKDHHAFQPDAERLASEVVERDYIALTQMPGYANEAGWKNEAEQPAFIEKNKLRFLRDYQKKAVHAVQRDAKKGAVRFLFEMATGTGKTLTSAAIIKLFLKTGNARRVLFLVDRIELEVQADKAFKALLKNDFTCVIYKEQRDDWRKADIVVTTVQSLLFNDKFRRFFAPTDFDLVISDEAHRSIGGNARAVFEYFVGYKLGLTATPKDYLKQSKNSTATRDPRDTERRMMLDTYRIFGCDSGEPTFRYSLLDGVREKFLINPYVVDARTEGLRAWFWQRQLFVVLVFLLKIFAVREEIEQPELGLLEAGHRGLAGRIAHLLGKAMLAGAASLHLDKIGWAEDWAHHRQIEDVGAIVAGRHHSHGNADARLAGDVALIEIAPSAEVVVGKLDGHGLRIHDFAGDLHGEVRLVSARPDFVGHFVQNLGKLGRVVLADGKDDCLAEFARHRVAQSMFEEGLAENVVGRVGEELLFEIPPAESLFDFDAVLVGRFDDNGRSI